MCSFLSILCWTRLHIRRPLPHQSSTASTTLSSAHYPWLSGSAGIVSQRIQILLHRQSKPLTPLHALSQNKSRDPEELLLSGGWTPFLVLYTLFVNHEESIDATDESRRKEECCGQNHRLSTGRLRRHRVQ